MPRAHCAGRRPGFTILELLTALVLSAIVLVGVLGVVEVETKRLSLEREQSDASHTLRAAAALISWDLRQAAAGDTALAQLTDTSFVVRSPVASGVVCAKDSSGYTLSDVAGVFRATVADSVQILFAAEAPSWEYFRVKQVGPPGTIGPRWCVTGDPADATIGVRLDIPLVKIADIDTLGLETGDSTLVPRDTSGILIGVPFMAFRRTLYGICSTPMDGCTTPAGERWLGRRVAGSPTWELLTGPLQEGGLHFFYADTAGNAAANPADVVAVRIMLRAESYGQTHTGEKMRDSLNVRVNLRNCDPRVC